MTPYSEEIKRKVIQDLNTNYGEDLLDLEKCNELRDNLLRQKNAILKEVRSYKFPTLIFQLLSFS